MFVELKKELIPEKTKKKRKKRRSTPRQELKKKI